MELSSKLLSDSPASRPNASLPQTHQLLSVIAEKEQSHRDDAPNSRPERRDAPLRRAFEEGSPHGILDSADDMTSGSSGSESTRANLGGVGRAPSQALPGLADRQDSANYQPRPPALAERQDSAQNLQARAPSSGNLNPGSSLAWSLLVKWPLDGSATLCGEAVRIQGIME